MQVLVQFFKDMNPIRLAALVFGGLSFIVILILFLSKISSHDMSVLYSELDLQDSAKVVQELESKNIPYQLASNGSVIKVSADQVTRTRVVLAELGLPSGGSMIGYEVFDKEDGIGTTNFSQNIKFLRALEGEIARTLSGFEQIDRARVLLVLPQREVFSKEHIEPKASVVLKIKQGKSLNKSEIEAIGHLVVTAVPHLEMKNITIVDNFGKSLKLGALENDSGYGSSQNDDYRVSYENRLKQKIENLLEQSFGVGKVKAQVAADMNFDKIVTNYETYDPDSAVIRSTQSSDDHEKTPVAGDDNLDLSVANNIPGFGNAPSDEQSQKFATVDRSEQTVNYEISKIVKNYISETGTIKRISVGILIDGSYKKNPETGLIEYVERSKEELSKIENLVKVAMGFNEERQDKVEVVNLPFATALEFIEDGDQTKWWQNNMPKIFQTVVFGIIMLLVLITVIKPIMFKIFEVKVSGDFLPSASGASTSFANNTAQNFNELNFANNTHDSSVHGVNFEEVKLSKMNLDNTTKSINDVVFSSTHETVAILRKWLNERSE